MKDKAVNAGVDAQNGFALQRNMALFILLDNYDEKFKGKKYFVSLEHHDDFLFCFLDGENKAEFIEAYQSKKKTKGGWTVTKDFGEILHKLLNVGIKLRGDKIAKTADYNHSLNFSSNTDIILDLKLPKGNNPRTIPETINEENSSVSFTKIDSRIQESIKGKINDFLEDTQLSQDETSELENLNFLYIAFTRTDKEQKNQLHGKIQEVFGELVDDQRAALDTIISLFHDVEKTYNQGSKADLLDIKKRVGHAEIDNALEIITTKSKAFKVWREQKNTIVKVLKIKAVDRNSFEMAFESAFDNFKNIEDAAHLKILAFVKDNWEQCEEFTDEDIVMELFNLYKSNNSAILTDITLKAVIFAAYFEVTLKRGDI